MTDKPHVLLLGNSVFMDGISESLLGHNKSIVTRMNADMYEARDVLHSLNPELVVYEFRGNNSHPGFITENGVADISHLAIDLNDKRILLFHYKCEPTGSMQELCDFISSELTLKNQQKKDIERQLA